MKMDKAEFDKAVNEAVAAAVKEALPTVVKQVTEAIAAEKPAENAPEKPAEATPKTENIDIGAAVKAAVKEALPSLGVPEVKPGLSVDAIKGMTPEQINQNWDAVAQTLQSQGAGDAATATKQ